MLFLRWNISDYSLIVASRCNVCDRLVGFSERPDALSIAEQAHASCSHADPKTSAVSISTADRLLFSVLEPILSARGDERIAPARPRPVKKKKSA
jgi:hypothetical protein